MTSYQATIIPRGWGASLRIVKWLNEDYRDRQQVAQLEIMIPEDAHDEKRALSASLRALADYLDPS